MQQLSFQGLGDNWPEIQAWISVNRNYPQDVKEMGRNFNKKVSHFHSKRCKLDKYNGKP